MTRPPRVRPDAVLYLDFDGVLHHEDVRGGRGHPTKFGPDVGKGHRLFQHAGLLEELLAPYPVVRIVLSTSWVRVKGYSYCVDHLPPGLAARCCGATWHSAMRPLEHVWQDTPRGRQVLADVERRTPVSWLALDDDASGWTPFEERVVLTDPEHGIAHARVREQVVSALERHFRECGR